MRKVLLSAFLVFLLPFSNSALANSEVKTEKSISQNLGHHYGWTEEKVNKKLKDLGLTEEQIGVLNWETKLEIVKDKEVKRVLSFERTGYKFDEGRVTESNEGVSTLSLTEDISLKIVALDLGTKNGHPYIKVVADYDWINMPIFRLEDGFAISWSEGWYGESWGFTEQQRKCSHYERVCLSYYWDSKTISNATDEDRLAGVGFLYDLTSAAYDAKGTAYVYLIGNDESKIKSTKYSAFKAWYGHDTANADMGISIGLPRGAGLAANVSFGGEEYTTASTSIYNPGLSY